MTERDEKKAVAAKGAEKDKRLDFSPWASQEFLEDVRGLLVGDFRGLGFRV